MPSSIKSGRATLATLLEDITGKFPLPRYTPSPLSRTEKGKALAKNKRKPSAAQRDKNNIELARLLKQSGIISKQANLHSGRHISRDVLAKVRKYEDFAHLNYGTVKVKKEVAKAAKERGYQVVQGNRIVGPKEASFRNRLKAGKVTGIKPVKGGYMEEIMMPHTVFDMQTLVDQLEQGIDTYKMPNEQFAFKYKGSESYRAFRDSQDLLNYLQHYKGIRDLGAGVRPEDLQEEFEALTLFRLHPNAISLNIPSHSARKKRSAERRAEKIRNGEWVYRDGTRRKKSRDDLPTWKADKIRAEEKERARRKREKMRKENPAKYAEYKAAGAARSKASRERWKK